MAPLNGPSETIAELERRLEKLGKINAALMNRVERSMDQQANAFSLFQAAIGLENQVRLRTHELKHALDSLEIANDELVEARDAAERANRFKTRFFTAVGHDLLQPLHAARLSVSALSEETAEENRRRLIGQVDHALSSIDELLRTILDLSKLEAGVIRPAITTVPLNDLFCNLGVDVEPIARDKGLALTCAPTRLAVRSDGLMLRRILQNLMANAVSYTERGRVLVTARRRGTSVEIEVWDTGPGIEESEQRRIFEEFQRGSASGRSAGAGIGLGLAIVQRTAEALGHRVRLCSRPGHGTRFTVIAPYAGQAIPAATREPGPPPHSVYGLQGRLALVIDNDLHVVNAMRNILASWSCEVVTAQSLREIEALLAAGAARAPDIVLADFHLESGETGLEGVQRVRAAAGRPVPAIIITADQTAGVEGLARAAGCEILRKPVRPAELRALVQHVLR